ncbi:MAG: hypothetical protein JWP57_3241 [Spirosoma sp.]|nr:hypothetical protein [Spirosoma sp.]
MPFEKGKPKTGGRKSGSVNKTTSDLKSRIADLIDDHFETISEDLKALEPKDRIVAYQRFMEYVLPKQREQRIDLSSLTDQQIDDLLDKALDKLN